VTVNIRRILCAALVFSGLAIARVANAQSSENLDALLAQAVDMQQAGDLLGAVEAYRVILQTVPDRADVRSNLGAAYVKLGRLEDGLREYREAIRLDEANPTYHFNYGLALYKSGQHEAAATELQRVTELDASNRGAVLLLGDCLLQLGRDADVIALLSPRDADFSSDLAYAYILGMALVRRGEMERGQVLIDRIFKAGESAEGHLLMGMAHLNTRDYKSAVAELARANELNPKLPKVHSLYGRALLASGDQEAANRQFGLALEADPNDFDANLQLGGVRQREQRLEEALVYLNRAAALQPDNLAVRQALASVYLAQGKTERALTLLESVVKEAPDFVDARVLLATTYYRLKRKEDGDRERAIVARLTAERQAKQPGARDPQPSAEPATPAPPQSPDDRQGPSER
jgi:tetratricopeptide (TPR) repeat protein